MQRFRKISKLLSYRAPEQKQSLASKLGLSQGRASCGFHHVGRGFPMEVGQHGTLLW